MYGQRTIPAAARLLPRHPRGRQAGRAFPQLLQSDGDEHLGLQPVRRRPDHRPLPRRPGRALADHAMRRAMGEAGRPCRRRTTTCTGDEVDVIAAGLNHQTWFIKVNWRGRDMLPHLLGGISRASRIFQDRKGPHRCAGAVRLLQHRIERPPERISSLVPQAPAGDQAVDRSLLVDQRRNRRLPARLHRGPLVVRDRFPELAEGARAEDRAGESQRGARLLDHRVARDRTHLSRPFQCAQSTATSPICPTAPSSRFPVMSIARASTCPWSGDLPLACAATCAVSARVQQMSVEAAVHGDVTLLKQAMLHDPLVGAVCNPEEVWQMTDEMLVALAPWLPQYAAEIPKARRTAASAREKRDAGDAAKRSRRGPLEGEDGRGNVDSRRGSAEKRRSRRQGESHPDAGGVMRRAPVGFRRPVEVRAGRRDSLNTKHRTCFPFVVRAWL